MAVIGEETESAPARNMSAYQIRLCKVNLQQTIVMTSSPDSLHTPQQKPVEAPLKRELRLLKNRQAAQKCRRKQKEYVKCLEDRLVVLEKQNKMLIEELKALKDLYCHKVE